MIKILFKIVLFLLYAISVQADTEITSLPFTCSIASERYYLTQDLTENTGTAITITASDVEIDGQGFTINYAQTGNGIGVDVNNQSGAEIHHITLSPAYTVSDGGYVRGIYLGSATALSPHIHDCTIYTISRAVVVGDSDSERGIEGECSVSGTIENNVFYLSGVDRGKSVLLAGPWSLRNNTLIAQNHAITTAYPIMIVLDYRDNTTAITVSGNTIHVLDSCTAFYVIGAGLFSPGEDAHQIIGNTINYAGTHGRIISADNLSKGWLIKNNEINVTSSGTGNIYGIRYRNANNAANGGCGGENIVENNDVDCSTYTGSGNCFPISVGGFSGDVWAAPDCEGSRIRYNVFKAKSNAFDHYVSDPSGDVNLADQDIYCNKFESTATGGYPIFLDTPLDDIKFSYNQIITNHSGGYEVLASLNYSTDVTICGSGTIDVNGGGSVTVTSSGCQDGFSGCYSEAGLISEQSTQAQLSPGTSCVSCEIR